MKNLTTRGIVTISFALSLLSIPLVLYIHRLEESQRAISNTNYQGQFGGEILVPLLIFLGVLTILSRYKKRDKHGKL